MTKNKKKTIIVSLVILLLAACVAVAAVAILGKGRKSGTDCTVKFELCTELKTSQVLEKVVSVNSFLEEPEVYVLEDNEENWEISGWYRDEEYDIMWDFDFDTVTEDVTLYAKWETNPQCTVSFYTKDSEEPVTTFTLDKGLVVAPCDDKFVGREVLGYYTDKEMKNKFDFNTKIEENMSIWVDVSEYIYFTGKEIAKWNLCGNQAEAQEYESSVQTSPDRDTMTISTKHGGYLWLKDLALKMNGTSIIEVKMKELNGDYSGNFGGYVCGSYEIDKEPGVNGDFGQDHTGPMFYSRSKEADEDGFYTYTCNTSSLTPGLIYTELNGLRIDFWDSDEDRNMFTYEIKDIKSYVDQYAVSGKDFKGNGIDFSALHLNTFLSMGNANTEIVNQSVFRFGGPHGAMIYKKELEIKLGDEQVLELKAKGDLKGGSIVMYLYGDYTLNGKAGALEDFAEEHKLYFTPQSTDSNGYTTYTAYIGSISGLKYTTLRGLRIDLYGDGTRSIDIASLKSKAPTREELALYKSFNSTGLNLVGSHFQQFIQVGEPKVATLRTNGDYRFGGKHGVFLYKKDMNVTLDNQQRIVMKAKGNLNNGLIALYLYGEYTLDGKKGETKDYTAEHRWDFVKGAVDKDGYTTYTVDISSIPGLQYKVIKGLRIDLYGDGERTIDIKSVKSTKIPAEEAALDKAFDAKGVNLKGAHFAKFIPMGELTTSLRDNGDFRMSGKHGAFVYRKNLSISLGNQQRIVMKAKGDLKNGLIALYLYGEYTLDGKKGETQDYTAEHRWDFVKGAVDKDGYTTYTVDISSIPGLQYKVIKGLRIDLYGDGMRTIDIKSVKSTKIPAAESKLDDAFDAKVLNLTGAHLAKFIPVGELTTSLRSNGDFRMSGKHGSFIHRRNLSVTLGKAQTIQIKAKGNLNGGVIGMYLYGTYTQNGKAGTLKDYSGDYFWTFTAGATDAEGYTTYTVTLSDKYPELVYKKIEGLRIELWGEKAMQLDIKSVKAIYTKTPEVNVDKNTYLNLSANDLATFYGIGATIEWTADNSAVKVSGGHGAFIHMKDLVYDVTTAQTIEVKAKVSKGTRVGVYMFGDYTVNGKKGSTTDYGTHVWELQEGATDKDGYTSYTFNIEEGYPGLKYTKVKGFRIDLWDAAKSTVEIKYVKALEKRPAVVEKISVNYYVNGNKVLFQNLESGATLQEPTMEQLGVQGGKIFGYYTDEAMTKKFDFNTKLTKSIDIYVDVKSYLYLPAEKLATFYGIGVTTAWNIDNTALRITGGHGSFVHMTGMDYVVPDTQKLQMKAKVSEGTNVIVYLRGTYEKDGKTGTIADYSGDFWWQMIPGTIDEEGYTTYTLDLSVGHEGYNFKLIEGFRLELQGNTSNTVEVKHILSQMVETTELTVQFHLDGSVVYTQKVEPGVAPTRPTEANLGVSGKKIVGFFSDADCTIPYNFGTPITTSMNIYVKSQSYLNLQPADLATFYGISATTAWNPDGTALIVNASHGGFIHMINMDYAVGGSQKIQMKAKVSEGTSVVVYFRGTYMQDGVLKTVADYTGEQYWVMTAGETDIDGYTTYTLNLQEGHPGCEYMSVEGLRIETWNNGVEGTHTLEIKEVKTVTE